MGTKILSIIARCPNSGGFWYIFGGRGIRNQAVEHNMAAFSELSFAVRWQGRLVRVIGQLSTTWLHNMAAVSELSFAVRWQGRLILLVTALI